MGTKPLPPVKKLVVLEDAILVGMANQPQFLKEFPFLKSLKNATATKKFRSCCGARRKEKDARTAAADSIKQTIAGMGDDKKRLMKKLLNTEKIRVTFRQGKRVKQHTY